MSKDPAFLFYYQDFLVGTDHMTNEQVGGYIKCLCHQAARGSLMGSHMLSLVGSQGNFAVIAEKFQKDENGRFFNKRLRFEIEKRRKFTESRLKNLHMAAHMENENENENINENIKDNNKSRMKKPTIEEITAYCLERRNYVEPHKFFNHYESNGWKVGKVPMKDWKAAVRKWEDGKFKPKETALPKYESRPEDRDKVSKLISETVKNMTKG